MHNLCYISLTSWEDTPNWMKDFAFLTQMAPKKFSKDSNPTCKWSKLIWTSSIPPAKTLVF